jgi:hypothetical protein
MEIVAAAALGPARRSPLTATRPINAAGSPGRARAKNGKNFGVIDETLVATTGGMVLMRCSTQNGAKA